MYPERTLRALQRAQANIKVGNAGAALDDLQKIVSKVPKGFEGWLFLGQAKGLLNDHAGAEQCLRKATALQPKNPDGWNNLGQSFSQRGMYEQACPAYAKAVALSNCPHPDVVYNLASTFLMLSRYEEAAQLLEGLLDTGNNSDIWLMLGMSYQGLNSHEKSLDAYLQAAERGGGGYTLHLNLGTCYHTLNDFDNAVKHAQLALNAKPGDDVALCNLGSAHFGAGRLLDALDAYAKSDLQKAHEARLLCLCNVTPLDPLNLKTEHEKFAQRFLGSPSSQSAILSRQDGSALNVGFLSGDFREHPVSFFIEGMLEQIDRTRVKVQLYSTARNSDGVTDRFRALADGWHNVVDLDDATLAEKVAGDNIHIMIDLAGYTDGGRISAFASRLAPVQAAYLGYSVTTGVQAMDYLLTDDVLAPPGQSEPHYTEQLVRLGQTFASYTPPLLDVPVGPLPMLRNGYPTFGSFAHLRKISPDTLDLWCAALSAVPSSRIRIVSKGLHIQGTADALLNQFSERGIDRSRVALHGAVSMADFLEAHNEIDLILDSVPWNGHTTTLHGLWMGVPTMSVRGNYHTSRFGEMALSAVGLADWIAETPAQFGANVAKKASDHGSLADLRMHCRESLLQSALCDHAAMARRFESACEWMWENRRKGQGKNQTSF